ncbi:reverse transcriptase domain-containing protein [Tanacetum coccineum]
MLRTFPFLLSGEAKTWLNELNEGTMAAWNEMREAFVSRYFSPIKFRRLLNEIHSFHQLEHETFVDAWLQMKEMLRTCYGHGLTKGAIIQTFYHGSHDPTQGILDAGGIFPLLQYLWKTNIRSKDITTKIPTFPFLQQRSLLNSHYPYPRNRMPHPSQYFERAETSTEEMMREWMGRQTEANERMKDQMVELENQINQGLRNRSGLSEK